MISVSLAAGLLYDVGWGAVGGCSSVWGVKPQRGTGVGLDLVF